MSVGKCSPALGGGNAQVGEEDAYQKNNKQYNYSAVGDVVSNAQKQQDERVGRRHLTSNSTVASVFAWYAYRRGMQKWN